MHIVKKKKQPMTELDAMKHRISIVRYGLVSDLDKERLKIYLAEEMANKEARRFG
ncbi:MAG: hypothetical protein ACI8QT_000012 [Halioglobus sp.]|jgi:hypothetical protein